MSASGGRVPKRPAVAARAVAVAARRHPIAPWLPGEDADDSYDEVRHEGAPLAMMLLLLNVTTTMLSPLDDSDIRAGATGFNQTKTALALNALMVGPLRWTFKVVTVASSSCSVFSTTTARSGIQPSITNDVCTLGTAPFPRLC